MALTPSNTQSDSDKQDKRKSAEEDAMLREVDDAVRQDQFSDLAKRFGIPLAALLGAGLLAFAGWLWWNDSQEATLEAGSEKLVLAIDKLDHRDLGPVDKELAAVAADGSPGAVAVAKMLRAGIALQGGKRAAAAALYAEVAGDERLPKIYRDLATIREVAANYEKLKPAEIEARLKPLATPGTPYFGSAAELLGASYLDQGKKDLAGPLFAAIATDKDTPESLRTRARQMASLLGVDAIIDVNDTLDEMAVAPKLVDAASETEQ